MAPRTIILTDADVASDLEWLEVEPNADWKEKARALYEDNPVKYRVCALARFFDKDPRGVAHIVDPVNKPHKFDKLKRKIRQSRVQKTWYERNKADPEFMARRAAACKRHRARQRNNKKLGWANGRWDGL